MPLRTALRKQRGLQAAATRATTWFRLPLVSRRTLGAPALQPVGQLDQMSRFDAERPGARGDNHLLEKPRGLLLPRLAMERQIRGEHLFAPVYDRSPARPLPRPYRPERWSRVSFPRTIGFSHTAFVTRPSFMANRCALVSTPRCLVMPASRHDPAWPAGSGRLASACRARHPGPKHQTKAHHA